MKKSDGKKSSDENMENDYLSPGKGKANHEHDLLDDQFGDNLEPLDGQIELIGNPGRRGHSRNIAGGYNDADISQVSRKDISNHALDLNFEDNMENQINAGNQQDGKKFV